jgi:signal transduction histidine kinase
MLLDKLRSAWNEPRAPGAPARVWRDWALVGIVVPIAFVEGLVRTDMQWRLLSLATIVPLTMSLLWRRTHPLATVAAVFVPVTIIDAYATATGDPWEGLYTMVVLLAVLYALSRWGSGKEIILGGGLILVGASIDILSEDPFVLGDAIGAYIVVLATLEIGIIVRTQVRSRTQAIEQTRLQERELLARELHDTVAHHVSAIAIQAQAGRALAATKPESAVEALGVIEEEASRTLTEMRAMVGALRQGEQPTYAPQPGVADIEGLAEANGSGVRVDVELAGDLDDLRPAVDAALFRLAQESVTNAVRHARNATRVAVRVYGGDVGVRLTVEDDGESPSAGASGSGTGSGFGLVGMEERATLLGGTFEAGPRSGRGWTVDAVLPRNGGSA